MSVEHVPGDGQHDAFAHLVVHAPCVVSIPVLLLSQTPGFQLWWVWYVSVSTVLLQLALNLWLLAARVPCSGWRSQDQSRCSQ